MVKHVSLLTLNLAKNLTIYTNGDEAIASDIEANANFSDAQEPRVTIEKRRIKKVSMFKYPEATDVLVTLEDGTEIVESFIVSFFFSSPFHIVPFPF